jgi:hypothetical protein
MIANQHIWRVWADSLHRWGVGETVATFLEASGPLTVLGAQVVYIAQPALTGLLPASHLQALAEVLEDSTQTQAFADYLREG